MMVDPENKVKSIQDQANEQGEVIAKNYLGNGKDEGNGWYSFNGYERATRLFQVKLIDNQDLFNYVRSLITE